MNPVTIPSRNRRQWLAAFTSALAAAAAGPAQAQGTAPLFIAPLSLGPNWDAARPAQEQAGFREHSANLQRLRRERPHGVWRALCRQGHDDPERTTDIASARAEFNADPMVAGERFALDVQELRAFHRGCVA